MAINTNFNRNKDFVPADYDSRKPVGHNAFERIKGFLNYRKDTNGSFGKLDPYINQYDSSEAIQHISYLEKAVEVASLKEREIELQKSINDHIIDKLKAENRRLKEQLAKGGNSSELAGRCTVLEKELNDSRWFLGEARAEVSRLQTENNDKDQQIANMNKLIDEFYLNNPQQGPIQNQLIGQMQNLNIQQPQNALQFPDIAKDLEELEKIVQNKEFEIECPLSLGIIEDGVVAEDGHTYEKEDFQNHVNYNRSDLRSPLTRQQISKKTYPNLSLKHTLEAVRATQKKFEAKMAQLKHKLNIQ
jgi:FtsZ-binding cell division protein ZapB